MSISNLTSKALSSMVKSKFDNIEVDVADRNKDNSRNNVTDLDNLPMEKQEIVRLGQDTKHRKCLVYWMMCIVSGWLLAVLLLTSFNRLWCLEINDHVLITLLATTTLNVLGLSKIILSGLFRHHKRKNDNSEEFNK